MKTPRLSVNAQSFLDAVRKAGGRPAAKLDKALRHALDTLPTTGTISATRLEAVLLAAMPEHKQLITEAASASSSHAPAGRNANALNQILDLCIEKSDRKIGKSEVQKLLKELADLPPNVQQQIAAKLLTSDHVRHLDKPALALLTARAQPVATAPTAPGKTAKNGDTREVDGVTQHFYGGHWLDFAFTPTMKWEDGRQLSWFHGRWTDTPPADSTDAPTNYEGAKVTYWHEGQWEDVTDNPYFQVHEEQAEWEKANPKLAAELHANWIGFEYDPRAKWEDGKQHSWSPTNNAWEDVSNNKYFNTSHTEQMQWEQAHPKEAAALRKEGASVRKQAVERARSNAAERAAVNEYNKAHGTRWDYYGQWDVKVQQPDGSYAPMKERLTVEENNRRALDSTISPGRRRQIANMVAEQSRREAAGATPISSGSGLRSGSGPSLSRVDIPDMQQVIPPGTSAPTNDGGPDLVQRWISNVDARWNAIMNPNRR